MQRLPSDNHFVICGPKRTSAGSFDHLVGASELSTGAVPEFHFAADPDIDGFMGTGPVIAMSGLSAVQSAGREFAGVAGFDITPELLDAIQAGDVAFTIDQQQYLQGYLPVLLLYLNVTNANVAGGGLPILTGPGFVTPENAEQVKALVEAGTR